MKIKKQRVKKGQRPPSVQLPELGEELSEAQLKQLRGGNASDPSPSPAPGDEVLVGFEAGDPNRPIVLGSLWKPSSNRR